MLALLGGSAYGLWQPWPLPALLLTLAVATALVVAAVRRAHPLGFLVGVVVAFAAGGASLATRAWDDAWRPSLRAVFDAAVRDDDVVVGELHGTLRSDARVGADAVSLSVAVTRLDVRGRGGGRRETAVDVPASHAVQGGVLLSVSGRLAAAGADRWRAGRTIRAPVHVRRPTPHRNPGAMDETQALARRGIVLVGTVKSATLIEVIAPGSPRTEAAAAARAFVRRAVARHVGGWSAVAAGVVTAILIGDRAGLAAGVERTLQEAGTYHVIAISGGNIAIFAALALVLFRWAGLLGRAAMATAIVLLLVYGQVVDGGASVTRAITVAVLSFAARALDHRLPPLHGLLVAAGGLVALDPLAVADPGFLLSFGATLGILAASPLAPLTVRWALPRSLAATIVASLAAEAALLPVVASLFGRITMAGLLLNLLAIPLMAVVQVTGMLLVPLSLMWPGAADATGWLAAMCASTLVTSASLVDWLPALAWRVARPSVWVVIVYVGSLGLALLLAHRGGAGRSSVARWVRLGSAVAAGAAAVWIAVEPWTMFATRSSGRLRVTFLDVGQGDATLVRFPRGATMLVDAGGSASQTYDVGDRVVVPTVRHLGIRRLDTVVLTHGDVDHVGGAAAVLRALRPFDVWDGVPVPRLPLLQDVRALAVGLGVRWTQVQRADVTVIDGVDVQVHHPVPPDWERQEPRNDDSIVLELRWHDVSIVLPGDIGREVESSLADQFAAAPRRVLKAAHHGSATSSGAWFIERLAPTVAIVSAGRGNAFGHPAPAVIRRLEARGASVYRTDQDGAITVDTDGHDLDVRTAGRRTAYWSATRNGVSPAPHLGTGVPGAAISPGSGRP